MQAKIFAVLLILSLVHFSMAKKGAGLIIFRRTGNKIEYLLLKSIKKDNSWGPPKGGVEQSDANDFQAALREVQEETNYTESDLHIHRNKRFEKTPGPGKINVFWFAELKSGKSPKLSSEHTEFGWFDLKNALKMCANPAFQQLIKENEKKIKSNTL
ncbi:bis(5'-nucleosyl)-tetraphosphatase [asymmetrical]-like [Contarinia nasturtii]|uniref:bis(5'-nucleosyl)-tetraphosphatase [asymmetrical]-like n=1 Tax=Contarinia nasturtii TaxID=265458 RepID=UPI0012D42228|nr:bis(5'-nucleosyl)-tetraphosphatase [asymmetrical]-like [Contarinia nasturtii]